MDYRFREEVLAARKAAMGEMVSLAKENLREEDKLINFASGHPSTEALQDQMIRKYISLAMEESDKELFQYGPHAGYMPLRKTLIQFRNQKGEFVKHSDDLLITYGSTEAVFLAACALLAPGDKVIVETPSYANAINAFRLLGGVVRGVSLEDDGVNLEELEQAMRQGAKLYYTIPNFGNPSGITMSGEKRRAVYELAARYRVLILEDDTYGELRYRKERIAGIKELDEQGLVIYAGSLSKLTAPAVRIGYMAADKRFINRILPLKAVGTNGVTTIIQYALWKMFEENDMYTCFEKICSLYREKLLQAERHMDRHFPDSVKHSSPDGGMYIWVTMPEGTDIRELCRESAVRLHIPITPGNDFCVWEPEKCTGMRFNFVKESMDDTAYGIEKVGRLMERYVKAIC